MATKLTPATLRRIVLEEKKKLETEMDKKALEALHMEGEEDWPGTKSMVAKAKHLKEAEARLLRQLRVIQEQRLALRKQILRDV